MASVAMLYSLFFSYTYLGGTEEQCASFVVFLFSLPVSDYLRHVHCRMIGYGTSSLYCPSRQRNILDQG